MLSCIGSLIWLDSDLINHFAALSETVMGSEGPVKRKDYAVRKLFS